MPASPEQINRLLAELEALKRQQESFQKEIARLESDIRGMKAASESPLSEPLSVTSINIQPVTEAAPPHASPASGEDSRVPRNQLISGRLRLKTNLEKFIGENLINKIGIAVIIIGVGIGAKYAIDHQLISPWTRIVLGYLVGFVLLGFAIRLRKAYKNFSAVLLSGSMAIFYFITYAAFAFYSLIPTVLSFILMVLFTLFTVASAIKYNRQVIAHIGLVGAYAVPFLLDDGSGRVGILFSYIALINTGILVIAFKKYWKPLYYSSFLLTWLIFISWYFPEYQPVEHFAVALVFISVNFTIFYLIFLADKLIRHEKFLPEDILMLIANSALFYGLGYATLMSNPGSESLTGLFTLGNALIHFGVAGLLWMKKKSDRGLLAFVTGLGLIFATIAIPVQLDGNWVTLLWCGEAGLLFWLGRTKKLPVYELLAYPLIIVLFFSLVNDWTTGYYLDVTNEPAARLNPLFNITFLTSLMVCCSLGFILYVSTRQKYSQVTVRLRNLIKIMDYAIPGFLLFVLFFTFFMEVSNFWNLLYHDSLVTRDLHLTFPERFLNEDLQRYRTVSLFNYSLLFFSLLSLVNIRWLKNKTLANFNMGFNMVALGVFLTLGLYAIGELRESYVSQSHADIYYRGIMNIAIRYVSFTIVALMLFSTYKYVRQKFLEADFYREYDLLFHITLLIFFGNELINWMDLYRPGQSYKLGLSILFGVYALLLIALGIWKRKPHLRIFAMVLFGATLLKLFLYDLSYLSTIAKTIVFITLGVLLLISSFLYAKYRKVLYGEEERNQD